ncbi:MAG: hypothetical protein ACOYXT_09305 [Bacteroidota bacterium]
MKINLFILLFASLIGCEQCEDDLTELEKLPPATQEGKNTFGCLVNGKAWVTKTSIDARSFYQAGILSIGAALIEKKVNQGMGFIIEDTNLKVGVYKLDGSPSQYGVFGDGKTGCNYTVTEGNGELVITNLEQTHFVISATFWMTLYEPDCDTIKITDGRFDIHYAP